MLENEAKRLHFYVLRQFCTFFAIICQMIFHMRHAADHVLQWDRAALLINKVPHWSMVRKVSSKREKIDRKANIQLHILKNRSNRQKRLETVVFYQFCWSFLSCWDNLMDIPVEEFRSMGLAEFIMECCQDDIGFARRLGLLRKPENAPRCLTELKFTAKFLVAWLSTTSAMTILLLSRSSVA